MLSAGYDGDPSCDKIRNIRLAAPTKHCVAVEHMNIQGKDVEPGRQVYFYESGKVMNVY